MPVTPAEKRKQARESMRRLRLERRLSALHPREQRLVGNIVTGLPVTRALAEAGFCNTSGSLRARIKDKRDLGGIIAEACLINGINPITTIKARGEALLAEKPTGLVGGDGTLHMVADHQARLKASELCEKALQAAGEWPSEHAPAPSSGHVRMLQVAPDGTETWIDVTT